MEGKAAKVAIVISYIILAILHIQNSPNSEIPPSSIVESQEQEEITTLEKVVTVSDRTFLQLENSLIIERFDKETILEEETTTVEETVPVLTVHSMFTDDELLFFYQVVEAEIGGASFDAVCNVVSVIMNRIGRPDWFGYGLYQVLNAEQFATVRTGVYQTMSIRQSTIDAVDFVFANGDTTNGCLFFDSTKGNSWAARNRVWVFNDGYHDFYR